MREQASREQCAEVRVAVQFEFSLVNFWASLKPLSQAAVRCIRTVTTTTADDRAWGRVRCRRDEAKECVAI